MTFSRSQNIVWEEMENGAVLVDTHSGARWKLNAAAASAWKLCDGTRTVAELAKVARQSEAQLAEVCQAFLGFGLLSGQSAVGATSLGRSAISNAFSIQPMGVGSLARRRPSPRGNSGPG